ncbi:MAG: hypothetical protein KAX38_09200, partial [Candidatus Krumholzibacteria bacterium]|nr:hypothetical protein [Candidatus Krumholzibacteria bacterium]
MTAVINAFFLVFIVLTLLSSSLWKSSLWCFSSWAFVSLETGVIMAALAASLLNRKLSDKLLRRSSRWFPSGTLRLLAVAAASLFILWLFRVRHDLWGERHIITAALDSGAIIRPGAPLASFLNWALFRLVNSAFIWNSASASALMSILAGTFYVMAALHAADLLHDEEKDKNNPRAISSVFLLSNGFVVLFFGAGGNTPLATLFACLFILSSILFLRHKAPLILCAFLLALSIFSHPSTAYLLPGFIYMLALELRSPERVRKALAAAGMLIACWIAVELILSATGNIGPSMYLLKIASVSIREMPDTGLHKLSRYLLAALNGFLIIGPASVAAIVLLLSGRPRKEHAASDQGNLLEEVRLLTLFAVPAIILFLFGAGRIDQGLRWENLASTGPALSLYVLWALRRRLPDRPGFQRAALLLAALGIFHTLPCLLVNVFPEFAEKRLSQLPLEPGRSETILGSRALQREDYDKAFKWFSISAEKDSLNDETFSRLGEIEMKRENSIEAISNFSRA